MSEKLYTVSRKSRSVSNRLLLDIQRRSSLNRVYERQSLALKKKLADERKLAYNAIGGGASKEEGGGLLGAVVQNLLLFRLFKGGFGFGGDDRRRRGPRVPPTPTLGPGGSPPKPSRITPRNNIVPFTRGRVPSTLSRVGPLAVLGTGLDFTSRLGSGQNVLQASLGAGGGLAGALAGGAKGAALGSFAGPIGTLIGGVGGSLIGGIAGGSIADLLSGANRRRSIEQERVERTFAVTEFSKAQDDFDQVLDKFEGRTAPLLKSYKKGEDVEGGAGNIQTPQLVEPQTAPVEPSGFMKVMKEVGQMIAVEIAIAAVLAFIPIPGSRVLAGLKIANAGRKLVKAARLLRVANNIRKLRRFIPAKSLVGRVFVSNLRNSQRLRLIRANATRKNLLNNRIRTSVERGIFPNQSRAGIIKRQGATELVKTRIDNLVNVIKKDNIRSRIAKNKSIRNNSQMESFFKDNSFKRYQSVDDAMSVAEQAKGAQRLVETQSNTLIRPFTDAMQKLLKTSDRIDSRYLIKGFDKKTGTINYIKKRTSPGTTRNTSEAVRRAYSKGRTPLSGKPKGKQEGGRVEAGKPYIVGEIGKELFVPDASGDILPNEDLGASRLVIINREPNTVIAPYVVNTSPPPKVVSTSDPYDIVAKYAQMTGLLTV